MEFAVNLNSRQWRAGACSRRSSVKPGNVPAFLMLSLIYPFLDGLFLIVS